MYYFKPNLWIVLLCINNLSYVSLVQTKGISCFRCFPTITRLKDRELHCSHFDGSAKFQTFCPTSTLCMKKTIRYRYKTSVATIVLRDCTPQKHSFQSYNENKSRWETKEEVITTAYDEGCFIGEHRGGPTDPPEYCFCNFHLCNSSHKQIEIFGKIYGIILVLLIMKLL